MSLAGRQLSHGVAAEYGTGGRLGWQSADIEQQGKRLKNVPAANKPSTLQDLEAGRKTEVDMFAGTMMRLGKKYGVPTPYNELFYHAIRVLEQKNDGLF